MEENKNPTPEEYKLERKRQLNREAQKRWRETHPQRAKELQHNKYMNNHSKYIQYQRDYRKTHKVTGKEDE